MTTGTSALFKLYFEYAVMGIDLSLDESDKIINLKIQPFKNFSLENRPVVNKLKEKDKLIDKTQLTYIYEYTKGLPNNSQLAIGIIQSGKISYYGLLKANDTCLLYTSDAADD